MDARGLVYQDETIVTVKASFRSVIVSSESIRSAASVMSRCHLSIRLELDEQVCLTDKCSATADQAICVDNDG